MYTTVVLVELLLDGTYEPVEEDAGLHSCSVGNIGGADSILLSRGMIPTKRERWCRSLLTRRLDLDLYCGDWIVLY